MSWTQELVQVFLRVLDRRLLMALFEGSQVHALRGGTGPLTIEMFLCALHRKFGKNIVSFFDDPAPFVRMAEELWPTGTRLSWPEPWPEPEGTEGLQRMLLVKMDSNLLMLLWQAARLALAGGRQQATFADFFSAIEFSDETVERLRNERGLTLKGHLGPYPGRKPA